MKHGLPVRTVLPVETLPSFCTPVGHQEDPLSLGQHRMCCFWNKAAGLSRSDMPSASWPVPRTAPKHAANGSHKGSPTRHQNFLLLLRNRILWSCLFPRSLGHKGKQSRFFYTTSSEKFGSVLFSTSSEFNLNVINHPCVFSTVSCSIVLRLLRARRGKLISSAL